MYFVAHSHHTSMSTHEHWETHPCIQHSEHAFSVRLYNKFAGLWSAVEHKAIVLLYKKTAKLLRSSISEIPLL